MNPFLFADQPIVLGLWPIAGITTIGVTETNARATIHEALDQGLCAFDTAFSYGYDGRSDRFLGDAIRARRDECCVIGKVGQRWTPERTRVVDATPATLIADAEESLRRIGIQSFDILMLHGIDPDVPVEVSAKAIVELRERGLCREIGVCNVSTEQWTEFSTVAGCEAIQCPLNLIQRASLKSLIPECHARDCNVLVYWTLMKGLLAGKITREHQFAEGDSRPGYPIFQGSMRQAVHNILDQMAGLAQQLGMTIPQLSVGWCVSQPGVTAALVGAHQPEQVRELASITHLDAEVVRELDNLVIHEFSAPI